jgi:4-aminobutyrate---pyruvate transaminase
VALETLAIYEERDILGHVQWVSPAFLDSLGKFREHPLVGDVRGVDLIAGVEVVADKVTREPFAASVKAGPVVQQKCEEAGLIVRAIGDRIAFTPPLVINEAEIGEMCSRFGRGLDAAWAELRSQAKLAAE